MCVYKYIYIYIEREICVYIYIYTHVYMSHEGVGRKVEIVRVNETKLPEMKALQDSD